MNLFDSLRLPMKIWKFGRLSPFIFQLHSSTAIERRDEIMYSITNGLLVLLAILALISQYLACDDIADIWMRFYPLIMSAVAYIAATAILIESFSKRKEQVALVHHLSSIDRLLIDELAIKIDYAAEQKLHKNRFNRWIAVNLPIAIFCLAGFVLLVAFQIFEKTVHIFIITSAYFMLSLRFHQYTTFVCLIDRRYRLLNELISTIDAHDLVQMEPGHRPPQVHRSGADAAEDEQPVDRFRLIYGLKCASNHLHEASRRVSDLFVASITACIVSETFEMTCTDYFAFEGIVLRGQWVDHIYAVLQLLPRLNNFLSMFNACENATEEVGLPGSDIFVGAFFCDRYFSDFIQAKRFNGCVHKLSFISSDDALTRLVCGGKYV